MLLDRPALAILALTAACLIAFGATLPLPRVDDQLVGSDGVRYYAYLPSLLLDGDLDFTDEYRRLYRSHPETAAHLVADRTATGLPANRFGIGPAVLWSPFFLAAHLLAALARAIGFEPAADGCGVFYQAPVLAGSILYGGLGAWLCFRATRRVASGNAALAATLLVVLAGNPIYYLTVEPSMPHALSMFASSAFFCRWLATRHDPRWRDRAGLGALAGLMALIRPQDGLLLLVPLADEALRARRRSDDRGAPGRRRAASLAAPRSDPGEAPGRSHAASPAARRSDPRGPLARWLAACLPMAAAALLVFLPQLVVWKRLNGSFLRSGYSEEFGALFHSPFPRLLDVLLSAQRGLFTWHPILLLAVAGLWWLARRRRRLAILGAAGFAIQWIVVASWRDWAQGDAFGGRMFIVCTPIFAAGLAALLDAVTRRWTWRRVLTCGGLLVLLNFLLLVQYRAELLALGPSITFTDLAFGRFRPAAR